MYKKNIFNSHKYSRRLCKTTEIFVRNIYETGYSDQN